MAHHHEQPAARGLAAPPPFVIYGTDKQLVQVHLSPGQVLHSAHPSYFLWSSSGVTLEQRPRPGIGSLTRVFSGMGHDDHFQVNANQTQQMQFVALSIGPQGGKIVPVDLLPNSPPLLVASEAYLGSMGGVSHQRMVLQCAPTAESRQMQRIALANANGPSATVFVQAGGAVVKKVLRDGESLYAQTACIVALTEGVLALPPIPGAAPPVVAALAGYHGVAPPSRGWGSKLHSCCLVKGPGTVYLSNGRASGARGSAEQHLVVVKLLLTLFLLGMMAALAQLISIEHLEL